MEKEGLTYGPNFHDDSLMASNGFDALSDHINKQYELMSYLISILETRLSHEEIAYKENAKISKVITKNETNDPFIKAIFDAFDQESVLMQKFCEDFKKNFLEPFRDVLQSSMKTWRKYRGDCTLSLKNRRLQHETAVKACKAYTLKYRAHEQFMKKVAAVEQDERTKSKISKSQQGVKFSESSARVSINMVQDAIKEWSEYYNKFCSASESVDRMLLYEARKLLQNYRNTHLDFSNEMKNAMSKLADLGEDADWDKYSAKIVSEKGTKKQFMPYVFLMECGEGDKTEFILKYDINPGEEIQRNSSVQTLKTQTTHVLNSEFYTPIENNNSELNKKMQPVRNDSISSLTPSPAANPEATIYVAVYDFQATKDDELSFSKGAYITVIGKEDESWYLGKLENGKTGVFPVTYTTPKKP